MGSSFPSQLLESETTLNTLNREMLSVPFLSWLFSHLANTYGVLAVYTSEGGEAEEPATDG